MKTGGRFSGLLKKSPTGNIDETDAEIEQASTPQTKSVSAAAVKPKKPEREKGRSHPDNKDKYVSTTVYVGRDVHKQAKLAMIEDGRELSELVEKLLSDWLESRKASEL